MSAINFIEIFYFSKSKKILFFKSSLALSFELKIIATQRTVFNPQNVIIV